MRTVMIVSMVALTVLAAAPSGWAHDPKSPGSPDPSPAATVSQKVGHTNVTVAYGRPGVKGREIWGKLVPIGGDDPRPWVAGANGSTIITFEHDVKINGETLAAGSYGLHVQTGADAWTFIFNKDASRFGIMKYSPDNDALRVSATPAAADHHEEWLAYTIGKTGHFTADLTLHWEKLQASFTVEAEDIKAKAASGDHGHEH